MNSLAFACILIGSMAGAVIFALLIVVVEHYQGGTGGLGSAYGHAAQAGAVNGRTAYVPRAGFLVVPRRTVQRVPPCAIVGGSLLFFAGLGMMVV